MSAYNCGNILKINRLWRTRSVACIPCKIFGYKNIRLNLKSEVFGVSIFSRVCGGRRLFFGGEHGVPSWELDWFLLEEFRHALRHVFLVEHEAEHVFVEPFVGHDVVALEAVFFAPAVFHHPLCWF